MLIRLWSSRPRIERLDPLGASHRLGKWDAALTLNEPIGVIRENAVLSLRLIFRTLLVLCFWHNLLSAENPPNILIITADNLVTETCPVTILSRKLLRRIWIASRVKGAFDGLLHRVADLHGF